MAVSTEFAEPRKTRIAQLSDLHCDASEGWSRSFHAVRELLLRARPDIVLVTGDCADHPKASYYRYLHAKLDELQQQLQISGGSVPVCVIPGNHDYNFFGNRIFAPLSINPFRDGLARYIMDSESIRNDLARFACEHNVLLYPFDSNRSAISRVAFARGRVDEAQKKFDHLVSQYRKILNGSAVQWEECIQIALLHHHPLPLPDTTSGERLEAFHILDNASEFLRAACATGVHLVLHGHKHVSGMAEYRYGGGTDNTHAVCVSACGTSAKTGASEREVCLFDVLASGTLTVRRVRCGPGQSSFDYSEEHLPSREVIRYAWRRKRRAAVSHNWPLRDMRIKAMSSKTKVVRIIDNGRAYVKITLNGLEWNNGAVDSAKVFREFLHGGIGRVAGGWYLYRNGSGQPQSQPCLLDRKLTAEEFPNFEGFWFDLPEPERSIPRPNRFELRYVLHNGYCVSDRDFQESYYCPQSGRSREMSTIDVLSPTESAELIVTFPAGQLPDEHDVFLDAWRLKNGVPFQDIHVAHNDYPVDRAETAFLLQRSAIHYRPELNQIAAVIRHPQPSTAYTLAWSLRRQTAETEQRHSEAHVQFRLQLQRFTQAQHGTLENAIRRGLDREEVQVMVFVYEPPTREKNVGTLRCVQPAYLRRSALAGRGVVGQGFRSRRLHHYSRTPVQGKNRRFTDTQPLPDGPIEEFLWVDAVLCEPLDPGPTEMLVIPLPGPEPTVVAGSATEVVSGDSPVAGVLLIARYGESEDSALNFFPFDLRTSDGCRGAEAMVKPITAIVNKVASGTGL